MKRLIYLVPILILVAVFVFFSNKPAVTSAKDLPYCNDSVSYCVEKIGCKEGFNCELRTSPMTDCRVKFSGRCNGLCTNRGCTAEFRPVYESGTLAKVLFNKLANWFVKPCFGTNCWSGGANKGYRDSLDQTGPDGAIKSCEAKLHVCFNGGAGDPAIPCAVDTFMECNQACSTVESNIACDPAVCLNRCLASRVPGYADTCD